VFYIILIEGAGKMAKILNGILGKASGKVGGVVAGTWKDKNYVRTHVIPANPNTGGQQTQRQKFSRAVAFAKQFLGTVLNPFVDPFQKSMSGFNYFIKHNVDHFTSTPTYSAVQLVFGKLFIHATTSTVASVADSKVTVTFPTTNGPNGLATDVAYIAVYDRTNKIGYISDGTAKRGDGTVSVNMPVAAFGNYDTYMFFAQYVDGKLMLVSNTAYSDGVGA